MGIVRVNELPEGSGSLSNDDIFLFMDNPSASGVTKKISLSQIAAVSSSGLVQSNINGIIGASGVNNIVQISQANYDALVSKDPNTAYFIV